MGFAPSASRLGRSAYIVPHFFPQSNVRFWSRPVTRGVALRARVPPNNGLQSGAPRGARLKPEVRQTSCAAARWLAQAKTLWSNKS
jgi:hypothetical protein